MHGSGRILAVVAAAVAVATPSAVAGQETSPETAARTGGSSVVQADAQATGAARQLPKGFRDRIVRRINNPMALAWTPDGRMLVPRKTGQLQVIRKGGRSTTALDLRGQACINGSRGFTSVAVDPRFRRNHFIYVYYTHDAHNSCFGAGGRARLPAHRVARYVLRNDDRVVRRTRKVIVDHILSAELQHNAGDLEFGRDGFLYISVGDGLCRVRQPNICGPDNNNAQKRRFPHGKILRVNRSGRAPRTNPFADKPAARRCTRPAGIQRGKGPCAEVFATGLRNPFRIAQRPGTSTFHVNDVGLYNWEEVDRLRKGRNYGWNVREGHCATGSFTQCGPTRFKNPLFDYRRSDCLAITGGAFVPRSLKGYWPPRLVGSYLFADYGCGRVFRLVTRPGPGLGRVPFLTGAHGITHLDFGPYKRRSALYYVDFEHDAIHRVSYRR